jgi:hypothetical protein
MLRPWRSSCWDRSGSATTPESARSLGASRRCSACSPSRHRGWSQPIGSWRRSGRTSFLATRRTRCRVGLAAAQGARSGRRGAHRPARQRLRARARRRRRSTRDASRSWQRGHRALRAGDPATAASHRRGGGLWRGDALEGFAHEPWATAEAARLEELRLTTLEDWLAASLELGEHDRLVPELEALVHRHPLRERLRGQLMLALYRSGRQADALEAFQHGRRLLLDELGIDPSQPLRDLERRILEQDPGARPADTAAPVTQPQPTAHPAAGPRPIASSARGNRSPSAREVESAVLLTAWHDAGVASGSLVVLTGEPGIGKSHLVEALATRYVSSSTQACVSSSVGARRREGAPPFWPWIQVIRSLVELDATPCRPPSGSAHPTSPRSSPRSVGCSPNPSCQSPRTRRRRGSRSAMRSRRSSAGWPRRGPCSIVLEDLHQADDPSLDLLDLLAEEGSAPCLVVATARESGANGRLDASLSRLAGRSSRHSPGTRGPFGSRADRPHARTVRRRSRGDEMVQALLSARAATRCSSPNCSAGGAGRRRGSRTRAREVPRTLREVIGRRLQSLSPGCREVLEAAAVIGRDAPVGWMADMLDLDAAMVLDRLEPAAAAGIVGPTEGWLAGYRFEHVLVRDVVVRSCRHGDVPSSTQAIADVLERLPDDRALSAIAHHRQQAAPLGQVEPRSTRRSPLPIRPPGSSPWSRPRATCRMRSTSCGATATTEPTSWRSTRGELPEAGDRRVLSPRVREAADRVRDLAGKVTDAPEVVGVIYSLWAYWMNRARYDQAMEVAAELVTAGTEADDLAARIAGHFTRGQTRFFLGSLLDAEPDLRAAVGLVDQLDEEESAQRGIAQVVLDAQGRAGSSAVAARSWRRGRRAIRAAMARGGPTTNHYAAAHSRLFMCWLTAVRRMRRARWPGCAGRRAVPDPRLRARREASSGRSRAGPWRRPAIRRNGIERIVDRDRTLDAGGFQMLRPLHLGLLAEAFALGRTARGGTPDHRRSHRHCGADR